MITTLCRSLRYQVLFLARWRPLLTRTFRAIEREDTEALPELIGQVDAIRAQEAHPRWARDMIRRAELLIFIAGSELLHDPHHLDRAIDLGRAALTANPLPWQAEVWDRSLLADCLIQRFGKRGDKKDVDQAIVLYRRAADLCRAAIAAPRPPWGESIRRLWRAAWIIDEEAVLPPLNRAQMFAVLLDFGDVLHTRFEFLRIFDDLQRAVAASEDAEALSRTFAWAFSNGGGSYGHERGATLSQLAALLVLRYDLLHDPEDIVRAVWLLKDADRLMPRRDARSRSLARHRVNALTTQGLAMRRLEDFTKADAVLRRRAPDDPGWLPQVQILTGRAELSDSTDGLAEAVDILEAAAAEDGSDSHEALMWLAATLRQWAGESEAHPPPGDAVADPLPDSATLWRRSSDAWRRAALRETAPAWRRLVAASWWSIQITAAHPASAEAAQAGSVAVRLLPLAAWRGLDRLSQEKLLQATDFDLATGAAAAQLAMAEPDPAHALELLELGRGVLWSQKLDVHTDLKLLQEVCPELAERLTRVRVLLEEARDPSARTGRARRTPLS
ncbi:hypothetical protein ACFYZ4_09790 [Streptomyces sp. NPDC001513]|uniref:hypothetical protein n=1 Tax=Streptomyces sp. NPDC001513 TaxID=3364580 RepID=UPI0036B4B2B4